LPPYLHQPIVSPDQTNIGFLIAKGIPGNKELAVTNILSMSEIIKRYLFIDESGDPVFYGNRKKLLVGTSGFQPYLIIGMIETGDRKSLRRSVVNFMDKIKADNLYNSIPSVIHEKGWYVHARGDHPEIRAKFFELLRNLEGYEAHVIIAKKNIDIFNRKHNNNPTEFYFDVLHHLLNGRLNNNIHHYNLYLSQRGNNTLHRFQNAVAKALQTDETKSNSNMPCHLEIVPAIEMPEFSIIDYLIWALQRKVLQGESRFFNAVKDKFVTIVDLYTEDTKN
jgi:hypothetical protein